MSRLELYRSMRRIRRVEEILMAEYHPADEMRCPVHFCVGQEAFPAALGLVLRKDDALFSHYRSHGYYLAKGGSLNGMIAEFYGKATGVNGGISGSMELSDHERNFFSGAIVGSHVGIAVGHAFAQKYRKDDGITVCVFGDGALDEGATLEAINLALVLDLPILFVCENNLYAAHTHIWKRSHAQLVPMMEAMGCRSSKLSDENPTELQTNVQAIVREVRRKQHPIFLELETYRFCSHVGPGDDRDLEYRPDIELSRFRDLDPLKKLRKGLIVSDVQIIDAEIEDEIQGALTSAKMAPFPGCQPITTYAGTYQQIPSFVESGSRFVGSQLEARLGPF